MSRARRGLFRAYDNRWVLIKTPNATGQPFVDGSVCTSLDYDAKRGPFWCGDASWNGGIWVLRLDSTKTVIPKIDG